jgi:hypothetical protein
LTWAAEGADGQRVGSVALNALGHALAHFLGRLVGEGDRGDALGRIAATADQLGDLLHDHPGLAAAGTGQHQQGAFAVQDGGTLGRVETVHQGQAGGGRPL